MKLYTGPMKPGVARVVKCGALALSVAFYGANPSVCAQDQATGDGENASDASPVPVEWGRVAPGVVLGVGMATAVAAAIVAGSASRKYDAAENADNHMEGVGARDRAERLVAASNRTWLAAGTLMAVGVGWGSVAWTRRMRTELPVTPTVAQTKGTQVADRTDSSREHGIQIAGILGGFDGHGFTLGLRGSF